MARRQIIILKLGPTTGDEPAPQLSLGTRAEVFAALAQFNTYPDTPEGKEFLYGPGIVVSLPPGEDEVMQLLISVVEEDIAWAVVMRICTRMNWALMDPDSGRTLTFGPEQSEAGAE